MAKVVVFGILDNASLAHFYFKHDSDHDVVGFSLSAEYMPEEPTFEGLPLVPFEEVEATFPPGEHSFFVPMSHRRMNRDREKVYLAAKEKGYDLVSYVSSHATVFDRDAIGENCFILEDNTLQPYTRVGDNVVLWSGNHIGHHSEVRDHVFFTSHVVLSGHCVVEPHCFLGVNAAIRNGVTLAEGTLVAMSACITKDTEPWGVYQGVPAKKGPRPSHELDF